MQLAWARSVRNQCQIQNVPFFCKQWGGFRPKSGGRNLDGRTWDEYPFTIDEYYHRKQGLKDDKLHNGWNSRALGANKTGAKIAAYVLNQGQRV